MENNNYNNRNINDNNNVNNLYHNVNYSPNNVNGNNQFHYENNNQNNTNIRGNVNNNVNSNANNNVNNNVNHSSNGVRNNYQASYENSNGNYNSNYQNNYYNSYNTSNSNNYSVNRNVDNNYNGNYNSNYNSGYNYNYSNNSYSSYSTQNSNYNQTSNYEAILNDNFEDGGKRKKPFIIVSENFTLVKIIVTIIIVIVTIFGIIAFINMTKKYSVRFYLNGASAIEEDEMKCRSTVFGHCYLTLPVARRVDGEVLGYSSVVNANTAEYEIGQKIEMQEDLVLYVVSRKDSLLTIDTSDIDEVNGTKETLTCSMYNSENKCSVTVPVFNKKGYDNIGYSETEGSKNVTVRPGDKVSGGKTLYPIYDKFLNNKTISVKSSFPLNSAYVDVDTTCADSIANIYKEYVERIESIWPFLFHNQKIVFMGWEGFKGFFESEADEDTYGLTYIVGVHKEIEPSFIRCVNPTDKELNMYLVIVHELIHSIDTQYYGVFRKNMANENDVTALYNKYVGIKENRPLSNYAFNGQNKMAEFLAELLTFYYLNYVDSQYKLIGDRHYYRGNFPDDMKKVSEKYICIVQNNYDLSKCK